MKRKSFPLVFALYTAYAVLSLSFVYILADMHINQFPGFSIEEGFVIAGELLVFIAFILALIDTKKTSHDIFHEMMLDAITEGIKNSEVSRGETVGSSEGVQTKNEIPDWLKPSKETRKGSKLSPDHKKKISDALKRYYAHKRKVKVLSTISVKKRKTSKK